MEFLSQNIPTDREQLNYLDRYNLFHLICLSYKVFSILIAVISLLLKLAAILSKFSFPISKNKTLVFTTRSSASRSAWPAMMTFRILTLSSTNARSSMKYHRWRIVGNPLCHEKGDNQNASLRLLRNIFSNYLYIHPMCFTQNSYQPANHKCSMLGYSMFILISYIIDRGQVKKLRWE